MPTYDPPVRDMQFLMHEVLEIGRLNNLAPYAEADRETVDAILDQAAKLARDVLTPINLSGDQEGCKRHSDGSVTTPNGFKEAYKAYGETGLFGLSKSPEYGGAGLPFLLNIACMEMLSSSNQSFAGYVGLSGGAWSAIHAVASEELKATYLPKMMTGEWSGTMNLTVAPISAS